MVALAGALLLEAHALHALLEALLPLLLWALRPLRRPPGPVKLAKRDAAVLVLGRHSLPLLHRRHVGSLQRLERVGHGGWRIGAVRAVVEDVNEANGDQAGPAQSPDGLGDDPFSIRLGNDDEVLIFVGRQLVGAALGGLEIVFDLCADDAARLGGLGSGRLEGGLAVARVMVRVLAEHGAAAVGLGAVALGAAEHLEIGDGDQAAGVGQGGIAGLVPVGVVLAADDVEKIALGKGQDLHACLGEALDQGLVGLVVIVGSDDLGGRA